MYECTISSDAGMRKPNLGFYKYVFESTSLDLRKTSFVDEYSTYYICNLEDVCLFHGYLSMDASPSH